MSRITLCKPPLSWEKRIKSLQDQDELNGALLLRVELTLKLLFFLNLSGETAFAAPAVLSGTPIPHRTWTTAERRAIANVRQIVPYAAPSAWRADLTAYHQIADSWRQYDFLKNCPDAPVTTDDEDETVEAEPWERLLITVARKPGAILHPSHEQIYHECLTCRLPLREYPQNKAKPDTRYRFTTTQNGEPEAVSVTFPGAVIEAVESAPQPTWFDPGLVRAHAPLTIHLHKDLGPVAKFFDDEDAKHDRRSQNWQERLNDIRYRRVDADGTISDTDHDVLHLDGFHHAAGMVASGKSTLSLLLAGWIARYHPHLRLTLVVLDVQSALHIAHLLNRYLRGPFTGDPAQTPAVVPIIGRRSRDKRLRDLHDTREWQDCWERGEGHWGERFLSVNCPLQGLLSGEGRPGQSLLTPGQEPCASLENPPDKDEGRVRRKVLCPLYARCPVHQTTHDLPHAPIWITTPQAMVMSAPPRQVEATGARYGQIIWERSDLVIFDEADAVMGVLDEQFAQSEDLTNGTIGANGGIYDRVGVQTERYVIGRRATVSAGQMRWSHAQRGGQNTCGLVLSLLNDKTLTYLRDWIARDYFTPYGLFQRIARRLAGLTERPEWDEDTDDVKRKVDACRAPFDALLGRGVDPLNPEAVRRAPDAPAFELWLMLRDIDAGTETGVNGVLAERCAQWINVNYPDYREKEAALRTRLCEKAQKAEADAKAKNKKWRKRDDAPAPDADVDTVRRLRFRLTLALTALLLDRHTDIIFHEWASRTAPEENEMEPHRNTPSVLRDVLPLPPLGKQFGTYYSPGDSENPGAHNPNRLSFLSYTNIGRWYLLHFHELWTDLLWRPGPHVLALSGTSYLPDAARLHLGAGRARPEGLLLPEDKAMRAIGQSSFTFLPLRDENDKPLRVSGVPQGGLKDAALREIARQLCTAGGGLLTRELTDLKRLGKENPDHWGDRERLLLLVNSYDQSRLVGQTLKSALPAEKDRIFYLSRSASGEDVVSGGAPDRTGAVNRSDIEQWARATQGRILVAPMSAIGRGYNILNQTQIAGFGAVYFLIRPYPHPEDMTALARELNRRALDWVDNPDFTAWDPDSIEQKFRKLRQTASAYWSAAQNRTYWSTLQSSDAWMCHPRRDLATYTAGLLVQAAGRLLRGGVPFHGYFVDAAFAPIAARNPPDPDTPDGQSREKDAPYNSLLAAVIILMRDLVNTDPVARALYEPLADALLDTSYCHKPLPLDEQWEKPRRNDA